MEHDRLKLHCLCAALKLFAPAARLVFCRIGPLTWYNKAIGHNAIGFLTCTSRVTSPDWLSVEKLGKRYGTQAEQTSFR